MAEPWTPALSIREAAGVDLRWFDFLFELGSIAARGDDIRERVFLQAAWAPHRPVGMIQRVATRASVGRVGETLSVGC